MGDGLDPARALLPGVRLDAVAQLGGNDRTTVERVRARHPDGTTTSYIVKLYRSAGEGWVRESAALSVLPPGVHTPRIVAQGREPPVLVLEDLGSGPSVADALLGHDPAAAEQAVLEWVRAIAELHGATRGSRDAFRAALAERQGELPVHDSHLAIEVEDAARALERECTFLDVRIPSGAIDELRGLTKRLGGSGLAALTPADTCPDNNIRTEDGVVLVDFEGAQWRHLAWDLAYLKVPWPSCWCAWWMPAGVVDRALDEYRRAVGPRIPEVEGEAFARDVTAAAVGWALLSTTWFLDNALGSDPALNPHRPTPTRRAMILHRLDAASRTGELPALAQLAGALAGVLGERWGDVPLAFAPAFRSAQ